MVTVAFDVTTCTFVRIVSAATKNPVPRAVLVWIVTTADDTRLTRSSSDATVASAAAACTGVGSRASAASGSFDEAASAALGTGRATGLPAAAGRTDAEEVEVDVPAACDRD